MQLTTGECAGVVHTGLLLASYYLRKERFVPTFLGRLPAFQAISLPFFAPQPRRGCPHGRLSLGSGFRSRAGARLWQKRRPAGGGWFGRWSIKTHTPAHAPASALSWAGGHQHRPYPPRDRQNFLEIGATCLFTAARYRSAAEKAQIFHFCVDGMRHGRSEIAQVTPIGGRMSAKTFCSFLRAHLGTAGRREWASRRELSHGRA